jgi:hypothetical protein
MFSLNTFTVSRCVSIILGSVFFMLYKDTVVIIILAEERIAIRIRDRHVFDSFKQHFDVLWQVAKQ